MQFLRAVSHSIKHAQPLQIPHSFWLSVNFTEQFWHSVTRNISVKIYSLCKPFDDSVDDSDPADNADHATNDNDTTSATVRTAESVAAFSDTSDCCEVCLLQKREDVALVPCGHSRFCGSCADTVASLDSGCPICRTPIHMVLRLFC